MSHLCYVCLLNNRLFYSSRNIDTSAFQNIPIGIKHQKQNPYSSWTHLSIECNKKCVALYSNLTDVNTNSNCSCDKASKA